MSLLKKLRYLLPSMRRAQERDMQEELASLRAMADPGELGNLTRVAEDARAVWGWRLIDRLEQDLRHAFRFTLAAFRREFSLSLVTTLTLALAICANTTVFSVVNALLFKNVRTISRPDELIDVGRQLNNGTEWVFPYLTFVNQRRLNTDILSGIAAYAKDDVGVRLGEGATQVMSAAAVSGNFFGLLETHPAAGRLFSELDESEAAPVAVISNRVWQSRFGGQDSAVGSQITVNRRSFTIVGVAAEGFDGIPRLSRTDLWIPLSAHPDPERFRANWSWLKILGRLNPGLTLQQAQAALEGRATERGRLVLSPHDVPLAGETQALAMLMAVPVAVLLIACANIAGIGLAKTSLRKREIGVRLALGSTLGRTFLQLLIETLPFFLLASALGVFLVPPMLRLLQWIAPPEAAIDLSPDFRVVAFTVGITAMAALLSGLSPAIHAIRTDVAAALKSDSNNATYRRLRLRNALVIGQIAVSLLLLVSGGLFLQTLRHAANMDPGFDADHISLLSFNLMRGGLSESESQAFARELLESAVNVSGVESASLSHDVPADGANSNYGVKVPGHHTPGPEMGLPVPYTGVTPEYFRTMRIPILRGRAFTAADRQGAPKVAIVSESVAERFWPDKSPIGNRYYESREMTAESAVEVVGVVRDIMSEHFLDDKPALRIYRPFEQRYSPDLFLLVRASNMEQAIPALRRTAAEIDPNVPIVYVGSMREALGRDLALQRYIAWLVGALGILGLILASLGVYGVTSYGVACRKREIGIRTSLGAEPATIVHLILREGIALMIVGLMLGLLIALAVTRLLAAALYGITPTDSASFTLASVVVALVAFLGCYVPARRASKVSPMNALRLE